MRCLVQALKLHPYDHEFNTPTTKSYDSIKCWVAFHLSICSAKFNLSIPPYGVMKINTSWALARFDATDLLLSAKLLALHQNLRLVLAFIEQFWNEQLFPHLVPLGRTNVYDTMYSHGSVYESEIGWPVKNSNYLALKIPCQRWNNKIRNGIVGCVQQSKNGKRINVIKFSYARQSQSALWNKNVGDKQHWKGAKMWTKNQIWRSTTELSPASLPKLQMHLITIY